MPRGKKKTMPHRRRREQKTDYRNRLRLLKSGRPRLVVRKTASRVVCQIVEYMPDGDRTLFSADTRELRKLGWKATTGSIPAAYLTGLLCGTRAKGKVKEAVADMGLYRSTKGSRLYAALKGVVDGGVGIAHSEDILPGEDRLKGQHIAAHAEHLKKESTELYKKVFSAYSRAKLAPEKLPEHFGDIKEKILKP